MFSILLHHFMSEALGTLVAAVIAAPLIPVLILYGGGALITLLFLHFLVFPGWWAALRAFWAEVRASP